MHFVIPHLAATQPRWVIVAVIIVVLIAVTRLPVVGAVIRLGISMAIIAGLAVVVVDHEGVDPYITKIATELHLDDQEVSGKELRVRMSPDGHFWIRASLDGVERRMLIDSGATVTALSPRTAAAAGLDARRGLVPILVDTANGTIPADTATLRELRLGNIVARKLSVVVVPAGDDMDVLGMNFLSQLKSWRVEGDTMVLVPHHPQAQVAADRSASNI